MSDDNFALTGEQYLAKYNIITYLEDSVQQLLEHRDQNPKVVPARFFFEYFTSVRDGNHTMFREFSFIRSTPHNRASFVVFFWKCFRLIGRKGDLLSIQEYNSLVRLLCPDFPFKLVQKTARIVLIDDALDCLISFSDFVYAFQIQFYYEEFLEKTYEIYQSQLQALNSPRDPVIVPTSGEDEVKIHQNPHLPSDGVDSMHFFRSVYPLLGRSEFSTPPDSSLREILFGVPRISFYGFLMAIAKSDSINSHIGRLPERSHLLEGFDIDFSAWPTLKSPRNSSGSRPTSAIRSDGFSSISSTHSQHRQPQRLKKSLSQPRKAANRKLIAPETESDSNSETVTESSDTN
ncbi:UPF0705 protein isoform X2 [Biomphalaria pfeifferi]|uniref:Centriolar satellite-associated tubulin polyglutamylase complex regulator 1 n=1 Tax=Biomphalaria pfeifferi TaxID=112525 RepID=A0AAD8F8D7_BIOPF|nr:UPF0705 protein isoform X2 [Biomphalaria pfeifferi]